MSAQKLAAFVGGYLAAALLGAVLAGVLALSLRDFDNPSPSSGRLDDAPELQPIPGTPPNGPAGQILFAVGRSPRNGVRRRSISAFRAHARRSVTAGVCRRCGETFSAVGQVARASGPWRSFPHRSLFIGATSPACAGGAAEPFSNPEPRKNAESAKEASA